MSVILENESQIAQSRGLTNMSADWLRWVDENISRGCSPEGMIDILVQNNYDRDYCTKLVFGKLAGETSVSAEPVYTPSDLVQRYEYEAIGPKLNGHRVKTNDREIDVLLTVDKPRIILFGNVLSIEECEQIIE